MSVRIGVDLDGVLADFASAYRSVREQLAADEGRHGTAAPLADVVPEEDDEDDFGGSGASMPVRGRALRMPRGAGRPRQKRGSVWERICRTENFWTTLAPVDPTVIRRLNRLVQTRRWDVFFITRRPATAGESVQRQTHRWLVAQGFETPSVLVVRGPRGTLAGALGLDFMIDDSQTGCVDVISDSSAKVFLVLGATPSRSRSVAMAQKLGITAVASASEALDAIEKLSAAAASDSGWFPRLTRLLRFESRGA